MSVYTKNLSQIKTNILNNFLNILAIELADNYLDSLKNINPKKQIN